MIAGVDGSRVKDDLVVFVVYGFFDSPGGEESLVLEIVKRFAVPTLYVRGFFVNGQS